MNWKEFKDYIESEGVTDDMEIDCIYKISECPPRVRILNIRINEIVIIN